MTSLQKAFIDEIDFQVQEHFDSANLGLMDTDFDQLVDTLINKSNPMWEIINDRIREVIQAHCFERAG